MLYVLRLVVNIPRYGLEAARATLQRSVAFTFVLESKLKIPSFLDVPLDSHLLYRLSGG
jgi:hypothetical protein